MEDTEKTLAEYRLKRSLGGLVTYDIVGEGLIRARVETPACTATLYTHGAHVALWQPKGQEPVLFMSGKSDFANGKAIRGGVPICYPWFGPRDGAGVHGLVRTRAWDLVSTSQSSAGAVFEFGTSCPAPDAKGTLTRLTYRVTVGATLGLELTASVTATSQSNFEAALHTYFLVGDIGQVAVHHLSGKAFIDKVDGLKRKVQAEEPLTFSGQVDRVYDDPSPYCVITDNSMQRAIVVHKQGSANTVVWNPWIEKAKAMPDFGDDEWKTMVCVETANAGANRVFLGGTNPTKATISQTIQVADVGSAMKLAGKPPGAVK